MNFATLMAFYKRCLLVFIAILMLMSGAVFIGCGGGGGGGSLTGSDYSVGAEDKAEVTGRV